jgi:hypothetical protein
MLNIMGLKSRGMISLPLDIPNVDVSNVHLNEHGDYVITIESMQSGTVCQHCGRKITKFHGHGRWIELRHLSILGRRVYIRLRPKQYECSHCEDRITTQPLDWYGTKSPHTKAYDHHLMLQLINSTVEDVSRKEDMGYDAIEGAIKRCILTAVNWDEFQELSVIGIDEIAMTKGRRNYVAIITTQQADGHVAVLAVLPDRKKRHWVRWIGLCVNSAIMLHGIRERIYQEEADAAIAATPLSYVQLEELQPPQHLHHTQRRTARTLPMQRLRRLLLRDEEHPFSWAAPPTELHRYGAGSYQ